MDKKNKNLKQLIAIALGTSALTLSQQVSASSVSIYNWSGINMYIFSDGYVFDNTSRPNGKLGNNFLTPVSGTLSYDHGSGAGMMTVNDFEFAGGSTPFDTTSFNIQAIGDGSGGPGTLVLGNMLYDWNGNSGIPVSMVMDAAGFMTGSLNGDFDDGTLDQTDVAGYGATPAADGSYVNSNFLYIDIGPVPFATTDWNTTNINGCLYDDCQHNTASGGLPIVADTAVNISQPPYTGPSSLGTGLGIGGNPMQDGPFLGLSLTFDVTSMTASHTLDGYYIEENCAFDPGGCSIQPVPVPAAVWLFGSGLLTLIGMSRRARNVMLDAETLQAQTDIEE